MEVVIRVHSRRCLWACLWACLWQLNRTTAPRLVAIGLSVRVLILSLAPDSYELLVLLEDSEPKLVHFGEKIWFKTW
jgi:hypothetical protein